MRHSTQATITTDSRIVFRNFNGKTKAMVSKDPTTQSNYLDVYTTHISLDWTIDFNEKVLSGSATHKLAIASSTAEEVM